MFTTLLTVQRLIDFRAVCNLLHELYCVAAFSALTLLVGRQEGHPACIKTEWWGAGMVICLERDETCIWPSWCHCHSLSLASVKSRLVLPFWYRLTWVRAVNLVCVYVLIDHLLPVRRPVLLQHWNTGLELSTTDQSDDVQHRNAVNYCTPLLQAVSYQTLASHTSIIHDQLVTS